MKSLPPRWSQSPYRARLLELYAKTDELLRDRSCSCAPEGELAAPCCRFAVSGHEPYPTAVEIEEIRHAVRASSIAPRDPRKLPIAAGRPCPLLSDAGLCRVYDSRPFGCRTYFCDASEGGTEARRGSHRAAVSAIGRQIADLSAAFSPREPGARPLTRALSAPGR
jgi:Fe-S-cluster containining protein